MMTTTVAPATHTASNLNDRLLNHAKSMPKTRSVSALRKLIEAYPALTKLRADGMSCEDLAKILEQERIHVTPGTIRNYRAKIGSAISALEASGNYDRSVDTIHDMVIQMSKRSPVIEPPKFEGQVERRPTPEPSASRQESEKQKLFHEPHYQDALGKMVSDIVEAQGPILRSHLTLEVAKQHGFKRTGSEIRKTLEPHLREFRATPHGDQDMLIWPEGQEPAERIAFRGMEVNDTPRTWEQVPNPEKLHLMAEILDSGCKDPFDEFRKRVGRKNITKKFRDELETLRARIQACAEAGGST